MLYTPIDVKFIFDSACLLASLGDKGLFSSANILQTADVLHWVVFLLFLLCFQPTVHLFFVFIHVASICANLLEQIV